MENIPGGSPLTQVLLGWFLSLFLPQASSDAPGAIESGESATRLLTVSRLSAALTSAGIEGLTKQYGYGALRGLVTETGGRLTIQTSGLYTLYSYTDPDPIVDALMAYVNVACGTDPVRATVPLLAISADGSVIPSSCGTVITIDGFDRRLPPFYRLLKAVIDGVRASGDDDVAGTVLWWMAECAQMPCAYDLTRSYLVTLPTLTRMLVRNAALFTESDGELSPRACAARALLNLTPKTSILGVRYAGELLRDLDSSGNTILNKLKSYIPKELIGSTEALAQEKPAKKKSAPDDDDPNPDDNESQSAYRSTDGDVANTVISRGKPPVINDNAMSAGNGRDTIDLMPLSEGSESANAFYYRRAVLALRTALENDPDANVSADARKTLNLWCQYYLFLADITSVKAMVKQAGLDKLLTPVGSSV